jgi:hydroxymethylpyrimidine/phosphomethylpyrimidine kinase
VRLLNDAGVELLRERLLQVVDWVTPNVQELEMLTGQKVSEAHDVPGACQALRRLAIGNRLGILAKGGHLARPDDFLLGPDGEGVWMPGEHVQTRSTHGTGCALSSAFLSGLVLGQDAKTAASLAKDYVAQALRTAKPLGRGCGPMNHLWPIVKLENEG